MYNMFVSKGPTYFLMLSGGFQECHLIVQNFYEFALLESKLSMTVDLEENFFHFLLQEMFKSSYFGGFPEHVVPVHDVEALSKNIYFIFGKMIATCLVQGGEPPTCFASAVADYLVFGRVESSVDLNDIPDFEVRNCFHKVYKPQSFESSLAGRL